MPDKKLQDGSEEMNAQRKSEIESSKIANQADAGVSVSDSDSYINNELMSGVTDPVLEQPQFEKDIKVPVEEEGLKSPADQGKVQKSEGKSAEEYSFFKDPERQQYKQDYWSLDPQDRFQRVKTELEASRTSNFGPGASVTNSEVLNEMRNREEAKTQEENSESEEFIAKLQARKIELEEAKAMGVQLPEDPELDPYVHQVDKAMTEATPEEIEKATNPTMADVERDKELIKAEKAKAVASEQAKQENARKQQATVRSAEAELDREVEEGQLAIERKQVGGGMNWQTGVGLMLGAISQGVLGLQENPVYSAMMKKLDREMEMKKFSADQQHKYRIAAMQEMKTRAASMGNSLKDQKAMLDIQKLQMELNGKIEEQREAALQKKIVSGQRVPEGISFDDLSKVQQERYIPFFNVVAKTGSRETVRKVNEETIPEFENASHFYNILAHYTKKMDQNPGYQFSPIDKDLVNTAVRSLMGQKRIDIVGPGIFQEFEQKLVAKIIGDPLKIFALSAAERAKVQLGINASRDMYKNRLKSMVGFDIPQSEIDKSLTPLFSATQELAIYSYSNKRKMSREDAIKELRDAGRLSDSPGKLK